MFLDKLDEAMSFASYMDVSELRLLYYGRLGIQVAFSDDADIPKGGYEGGSLERPWCITSHAVDTVVGRKASTHYFYGHIFRFKGLSGAWIEDIKSYTKNNLKEDIEALRIIPHVVQDHLEEAVERETDGRNHYPFATMWNITKRLAEAKGGYGDKYWRRLLVDLGYAGFNDPMGLGIIGKRGQQTSVLLDLDAYELFDIMPLQKYRKDKRQRIINDVNKKNKYNQTRRNRVAKRKTAAFRQDSSKARSWLDNLEAMRFIIGGGL